MHYAINTCFEVSYVSIFFERQIWITNVSLEYYRATSRTTRSYPSSLDNNVYTPVQKETQ
ncbi:hypothetical protein Hanom_Chr01g00011861 [Helianthus anomalus]